MTKGGYKHSESFRAFFRSKFQKGFSRQETIGISLILHLSVGLVFASIHFNRNGGLPLVPEDQAIEFYYFQV